ncbi:DUF805 domain-containing protein [Rhizobium sp. LjRoot254]|uniref:DUF805 domain-containing protein n=1 Tax=Rhizobium sp. LjRoot254 TaxID=3342297 RepID=UPI003ED09069
MRIATPKSDMFWLFFSPSGRISRQPYVMTLLFWMVLQMIAVSQMFAGDRRHSDALIAFATLGLIVVSLLTFVSMIMLTIKRVHDMGYPGLLAFLIFLPVVSFFALICFLFWPSSPPNQFGDYPNRPQ